MVESLLSTSWAASACRRRPSRTSRSRAQTTHSQGASASKRFAASRSARSTPAVLDTPPLARGSLDADVRVLATEMVARASTRARQTRATGRRCRTGRASTGSPQGRNSASDVRAARNAHYQPVALLVFVAEKDVKTIAAAVAKDRKRRKRPASGAWKVWA